VLELNGWATAASLLDETVAEGEGDGFGRTAYGELAVDAAGVVHHGLRAHAQPGNVLVRVAFDQPAQHIVLTPRGLRIRPRAASANRRLGDVVVIADEASDYGIVPASVAITMTPTADQ
jgi:hypothetical protein